MWQRCELRAVLGGASGWTNACSDTAAEQGLVDSLAVPSRDLVSRNFQLLAGSVGSRSCSLQVGALLQGK